MYDMIIPISAAKPGDVIALKMLIHHGGYVINRYVPLYFVELNTEHQIVVAATDIKLQNTIYVPLRAIQSITNSSDQVIYHADIRDMVYGI
jgi:hypothetical protein